ncbi:MAG: helix-hairpin-helix domain-containing protein [Desulfuromonadaceae bacterium]|nr:helix-hairpin-helix domain-containing protein [Desulfuromonadaceae bacterium]
MQRLIIIIIAVMVSLPVILKSRLSRVKSTPAAFSVISSCKVMVRVSGDVRNPGIYEASANTLTKSVINMAEIGDPVYKLRPVETGESPVVNGTDIQIKMEHDGTGMISVGVIPAAERFVLGIPIDINSSSKADIARLPGLGPVMARRIVEYRQKNGGKMRVEELRAIEGIGEKKFQKIYKYFEHTDNAE